MRVRILATTLTCLLAGCGSDGSPNTADGPDADADDVQTVDATDASAHGGDAPDDGSDRDDDAVHRDADAGEDSDADGRDAGADSTEQDARPNADARVTDADTALDADTDGAPPDSDGDAIVDASDVPDGDPDASDVPDVPVDPMDRCRDALVEAAEWSITAPTRPLAGAFELAQTHIVRADETRLAPRLNAGRELLLLFTPEAPLSADTRVFVSAEHDGVSLGALPVASPSELPPALEASYSLAPIAPYSTAAWSVSLPAGWVREGTVLRLGYDDEGGFVAEHTLADLAPPHRLTITRARIVLFGEPDQPAITQPAPRIARDFFAAIPVAGLRWVDYDPWRVGEIVVRTEDGPHVVRSEAERRAVASDADHWSILKHQVALRLSLANTGRGLALTGESAGDSSPYSFGTSVAMGWFRDPEGRYVDIDDAPWAAGWTGWTAMWTNECGNAFIHEVGHSFTLSHFTAGTASAWGIAEEYPRDGTNLASHPWGYDTIRRRPRTWYRVDDDGPVVDGEELVGKRDPMNGGERPNPATCFPQYTAYHARRIQDWVAATPTISMIDGLPGIASWDEETHAYSPAAPPDGFEHPVAVDTPVVTLIGALAVDDEACRIYPPLTAPSGNVFTFPDPLSIGLPEVFDGAAYFLEIAYEDATTERAVIARQTIDDDALYLFSLNLDATRTPRTVRLYRSLAGYPAIEPATSVLLDDVEMPIAPSTTRIVTAGVADLANGGLLLRQRCEPGLNCTDHRAEATWRVDDSRHRFSADDAVEPIVCGTVGGWSTLHLPVVDDDGVAATAVVHAQRVVSAAGHEVAVPIEDGTPWVESPDLSMTLRAWLPWEPNAALAPGRYRTSSPHVVDLLNGDWEVVAVTSIEIDPLEVLPRTPADLATEFVGLPLTSAGSSMYFLVRRPALGPTERVWWDDGIPGPPLVVVQVVDDDGRSTDLVLEAEQEACESRWDLHAGRGAGECEHRVVLRVAADGNDHLIAGRTYRTPPSGPLVIEGRRWHAPDARRLEGVFAFAIEYIR